MKMRYWLAGVVMVAMQVRVEAQLTAAPAGQRNVGRAMLLQLGYGTQRPGGDLSRRFGSNFNAEVGLSYLSDKTNWVVGLDGEFIFGNNVKEDVLANLRTPEGNIIGNDRSPADIGLRQRGFYLGAHIGKLISLSEANPRSGLLLQIGAGLLQHKIRVQKDPLRGVAALSGDYVKGYDRLTNGLCLQEFIGYQLLSNDGRLNFYFGLELSQAFTQNRRSYDYLAQAQLDEPRSDLLYGLRLGWILPFYFGKTASEIYY